MKPAGTCADNIAKKVDEEIAHRAAAIRAEIVRLVEARDREEAEYWRKKLEREMPGHVWRTRPDSFVVTSIKNIQGAIKRVKVRLFPSLRDKLDFAFAEQTRIADLSYACWKLLQENHQERLHLKHRVLRAYREIAYLRKKHGAGFGKACSGPILVKRKHLELNKLSQDYENWLSQGSERLALLNARLLEFNEQLVAATLAHSAINSEYLATVFQKTDLLIDRFYNAAGEIHQFEQRIVENEKLALVELPPLGLNEKLYDRFENKIRAHEERSSQMIEALSSSPPVDVETLTVAELKEVYSRLLFACDNVKAARASQKRYRNDAFIGLLKAQESVVVWKARVAEAFTQDREDLIEQAVSGLNAQIEAAKNSRTLLFELRKKARPTIDFQRTVKKSIDVIRRRLTALGETIPGEESELLPQPEPVDD